MSSAAIATQALEEAGLSTEAIAKEFEKLRGGPYTDDLFLDECLQQLKAVKDTSLGPTAAFTSLLEFTREKLNTGHWSEVPDCWRISYALLRLASAIVRLRAAAPTDENAVSQLQLALWELDDALIMGFCSLNESITRVASLLNELTHDPASKNRFPNAYPELSPATVDLSTFTFKGEKISELRRVHQPSPSEFARILARGVPVIITGAMQHWRALQPTSVHYWSLAYWSKRAGRRTVPVEVGSAYTDDKWGQRLISVDCFLERFILPSMDHQSADGGSKGYLAQHQLFLQIPELAEDVDIPEYCYVGGPPDSEATTIDSNIWFGPAGTVSPLHHDSDRSNVLCQVIGRKYVKVYTADQTELVYPHGDAMLCNTSQVDVVAPQLDQFLRFSEASGHHGCLEAGEMLFIPPRCWHYLQSLTCSISLNFWWNVAPDFIPPWPPSYAPASSQKPAKR